MDNFKKGFRSAGRPVKIEARFDQTDKPVYPSFETTQKYKVLKNNGWGIDRQNLKYQTAHPHKGQSIKREHLEYFDTTKPSNFAGYPAGFQEKKPEKILIDMDPEVYHIDFPSESKIPLYSLEMQRQSNHFQHTQSYLHRRAKRESDFGRPGYQKGIVA